MGRKRAGGYIFYAYKGDHPPLHVHIFKGREFIGRWDIENQCPMDKFQVGSDLRAALGRVGYLIGDIGDEHEAGND